MNKSDYKAILSEISARLAVEKLTLYCGIRANLSGSEYLNDAVLLYTEGYTGLCEIYRIIGKLRGLNYKSVMRSITYSIAQAYELPEKLSELAGTVIRPTDIHNGLVIATLSKIYKRQYLMKEYA